jgi:cytoskeletal protein CcmA (bactofilin family)
MFGNKKQEELAAQELHNSANTIGKGTVIRGDIETYGNIRIEGEIIGNIKSKAKVALGATAKVEGNIIAQNVEVEGEVKGVLDIGELLILKASAVVNGDIITSKMVVESGAIFNGNCKMGENKKDIKIGETQERKVAKPKAAAEPA